MFESLNVAELFRVVVDTLELFTFMDAFPVYMYSLNIHKAQSVSASIKT